MRDMNRSQVDIILALMTTFTVILFDRLTKIYFTDLLNYHESIPVIKNVFHFTLIHNTGIAFGLFKDQGIVFIIIPVILIFLLIYNIYFYKQNEDGITHSYIAAFSLILGGAIGNLYDRIAFGYVIDFMDFRVWPVFNVADSAITIGAAIIIIKCFYLSKK